MDFLQRKVEKLEGVAEKTTAKRGLWSEGKAFPSYRPNSDILNYSFQLGCATFGRIFRFEQGVGREFLLQ